jgi:ATPase subunit of ABC transporter with duplicated ATPase domains
MLIARDLRIEAGIRTLLQDASFSVQSGDRIGLVGRNGAGKTTLMRTLIGELQPAEGTVLRSGSIGYLSQEAALPELENPDATALERILMAREIGAMQRRIEHSRRRLESLDGDERDQGIARFTRLHDEFESKGGFVAEAEAKRIASNVGIGNDELAQPVRTMSGGQRRRVELARILFADTAVMLLDEPTNHLDLDAKAWLIEYLSTYRGGMLVVSHDLPLLDEAITSVLALEHGEIEAYRGNYTHYLVEREARRERKERERKHHPPFQGDDREDGQGGTGHGEPCRPDEARPGRGAEEREERQVDLPAARAIGQSAPGRFGAGQGVWGQRCVRRRRARR